MLLTVCYRSSSGRGVITMLYYSGLIFHSPLSIVFIRSSFISHARAISVFFNLCKSPVFSPFFFLFLFFSSLYSRVPTAVRSYTPAARWWGRTLTNTSKTQPWARSRTGWKTRRRRRRMRNRSLHPRRKAHLSRWRPRSLPSDLKRWAPSPPPPPPPSPHLLSYLRPPRSAATTPWRPTNALGRSARCRNRSTSTAWRQTASTPRRTWSSWWITRPMRSSSLTALSSAVVN